MLLQRQCVVQFGLVWKVHESASCVHVEGRLGGVDGHALPLTLSLSRASDASDAGGDPVSVAASPPPGDTVAPQPVAVSAAAIISIELLDPMHVSISSDGEQSWFDCRVEADASGTSRHARINVAATTAHSERPPVVPRVPKEGLFALVPGLWTFRHYRRA